MTRSAGALTARVYYIYYSVYYYYIYYAVSIKIETSFLARNTLRSLDCFEGILLYLDVLTSCCALQPVFFQGVPFNVCLLMCVDLLMLSSIARVLYLSVGM